MKKSTFLFIASFLLLTGSVGQSARAQDTNVDPYGGYIWVVEPKNDQQSINSDGTIFVRIDLKWGLLDASGQKLIEPRFEDYRYEAHHHVIFGKEHNQWGLYNLRGVLVRLLDIDEAGYSFSQTETGVLLPAKKDGKWGWIDQTGDWIIPAKFDEIRSFSTNAGVTAASARSGYLWGFIGADGEWIVQPAFHSVRGPLADFTPAKLDGAWGYIDQTGKWLLGPYRGYKDLSHFDENNIARILYSDGKWGYITKRDKRLGFERNYYTTNFDVAEPFYDGIAAVMEYGKWGFINYIGERRVDNEYLHLISYLIEPKYKSVGLVKGATSIGFHNGYAYVQDMAGNYFYIDKSGNRATKPEVSDGKNRIIADRGYPFYCYRDAKTHKNLTPPCFEEAKEFENGIAQVKYKGKWGIIALGTPEDYVNNYVSRKFRDWMLKDEFETRAAYTERMDKSNQTTKLKELFAEAVEGVKRSESFRAEAAGSSIVGQYDAENSTFLISLPTYGRIVLKVPDVEDARKLRDNWKSISFPDADFAAVKLTNTNFEKIVLSRLVIRDKHNQNKEYTWNVTDNNRWEELELVNGYELMPLSDVVGSDFIMSEANVGSRSVRIGRSDVDREIPRTENAKPNTLVLAIGNEKYSDFAPVRYSAGDAEIFTRYCSATLGVPEQNITLLTDATLGEMQEAIRNLTIKASAYQGKADIVLFYAGHGMAKSEDEAYIIPVDISNFENGLPLSDLYTRLSGVPARRVTVLLDACFSGQDRKGNFITANKRGVSLRPKFGASGCDMVVFSATGAGEYAHSDDNNEHGVFTYHLLKKIKESRGEITYGQLYDYLGREVTLTAISQPNGSQQIPSVMFTPSAGESWKNWKFTD